VFLVPVLFHNFLLFFSVIALLWIYLAVGLLDESSNKKNENRKKCLVPLFIGSKSFISTLVGHFEGKFLKQSKIIRKFIQGCFYYLSKYYQLAKWPTEGEINGSGG
jgi:hypothetical protein